MAAARIPATVITGFLGSGKTTLIRNIIMQADGRRLALLVNEFGDIGMDGAMLEECGADSCNADDIIELANGCICCTVADDFLPSMHQLLAREPRPDHIINGTDTNFGAAPLHHAGLCDDEEVKIGKLLLEYGADPLLTNTNGERPLELVKELSKDQDLIDLFTEATEKALKSST